MTVTGNADAVGVEADDLGQPEVAASPAQAWDLEHVPLTGTFRPHARPPAEGVVYAELPLRGVAYLADLLLLWFVERTLNAITSWLQTIFVFQRFESAVPTWLSVTGVLAPVVAAAIAGITYVYFLRVFRASPGQMLVGLFTLSVDGRALSMGQATTRWVLRVLPAVAGAILSSAVFYVIGNDPLGTTTEFGSLSGILLALSAVWPIALGWSIARDRERGRGLHDRLVGSVVVRRDGTPS